MKREIKKKLFLCFYLSTCFVILLYFYDIKSYEIADDFKFLGTPSKYELLESLPQIFFIARYRKLRELIPLLEYFDIFKKYITYVGRVSLLKFVQYWHRTDIIEYFIKNNYNLKKYINVKEPLLHYLISHLRYYTVELLIGDKYDPNMLDSKDCTPLGVCSSMVYHDHGYQEIKATNYLFCCMRFLVKNGADISSYAFNQNNYKQKKL